MLFKQHFDLVVLELNDPLLAFVEPSAENGEKNVSRLESDVHWTDARAWRGKPTSFQGKMRKLKRPRF